MPISKYHRVYRFPNGATLIYFKHNVDNTTRFFGGFISGAAKDKIKGTAHFVEHIMSDLAGKKSIASREDINTNAFTTQNYVAFYLDSPNKHIADAIDLLETMTFNNKFDEDVVENERKAILQERLLYTNQPSYINNLYFKTYSALDILGNDKDIKSIKIDDLKNYKDQNFVSQNYVLCVTSSLPFSEIKEMVEDNIIAKLPSDASKKNLPDRAIDLRPMSHFVYAPQPNIKTVTINAVIKANATLEKTLIYNNVDEFVFNDSFSGLLLKKFRTEKGLVYFAGLHSEIGDKDNVFKIFTITTSKDHVNEVIETLGEVLETARKGISAEKYNDYISKLKTIEEDRRVVQKYLDPRTMFTRYVDNEQLWFNNPVHKAVKLTREQINSYLKNTYQYKPVVFNIVGDFDVLQTYQPGDIQQLLKSKPFEYIKIQSADGTNYQYYSMRTGQEVDDTVIEKEDKAHICVCTILAPPQSDFERIMSAVAQLSNTQKALYIENLSRELGLDNLEKSLKELKKKKDSIEKFARILNVKINLDTGEVVDITEQNKERNKNVDERLKKYLNKTFKERLKLIERYAKDLEIDLNFDFPESQDENQVQNDDSYER